ncbi:MAG: hypothetical protein HYS13_04620 [Planctomycetia bacterium]|nr:hypothetical protein [Planctomycetia bacterium]
MSLNFNDVRLQAQGFLQAAAQNAKSAAQKVSQAADKAAEAVAAKCTEVTGRETTAAEVKKVAITAGVIVAGLAALSAVGAAMPPVQCRSGSASGGNRWGNDFQDQATGIFAEHGRSLNFYTPHVDSEGQIYSGQW